MSRARGPLSLRGAARQKEKRHGPVRRDQDASPFSLILEALLDAIPLSYGAALVDSLGETVDYAGSLEPFDVKVAAAHFQLLLKEIRDVGPLSSAFELTVRAAGRSYLMRSLDRDYSLLLILHRHGAFAVSRRALDEAATRLCSEAGLEPTVLAPEWFQVEVESHLGKRPARLRQLGAYVGLRSSRQPPLPIPFGEKHKSIDPTSWNSVEVIGTLTGTTNRERGYRIRLETGAEMTLVRERDGLWFVDEPP